MKKKRPELVLLVFILALFIGMALVSLVWKNNGFYTQAYRPKVERAAEFKRETEDEQRSLAPERTGFRERDIEKDSGRRYKTF